MDPLITLIIDGLLRSNADFRESKSYPMGIYLRASGGDGRRDYAVRLRPERPQ